MMGKLTPGRAMMLVLLLTFALYASLWSAPFLNWDDDSNIFANPFYLAGWWRVFWTSEYFGLWVPVTSSTWQTLFVLGKGAVWPFRLMNATLHVANVALVWVLVDRIARALGVKTSWGALVGATIFALHPLQVQTVAWISGGRDLLATFFALGALDLYFRKGSVTRGLATLAFAAACLSKPNVVVLPFVIAALLPTLAPGESWRKHAAWLGPWLVGSLAIVWWTLGAQAEHLASIDWWRRPWLVGDAFWFYESRLVDVFHLAPNYARTPAVVFAEPWSLAKAAAGFVLLGLAFSLCRARGVVASWALFLLPVSGIVSFGYQRISGVADHYAYPAMTMVAAGVALARPRLGKLEVAGLLAVLIVYTGVVYRRLDVWRSNASFFAEMSNTAPNAYATAIGMSTVACAETGDWYRGVQWTEVALKERPRDIRALANQAYCLNHAGDFDRTIKLEAEVAQLDRALLGRTQPTGYASLIASIGAAKIQRGDDLAGYRLLCEAERLFPGLPTYVSNLAAAREILQRRGVTPTCD